MPGESCRLCSSTDTTFVFHAEPGNVNVWACKSCGFRFLPAEDLDGSNEDCDSVEIAALRELDHREALRRSRKRLAVLRRYISNGCLLDVGCGSGELLLVAREQGFARCYGVEPAKWLQEQLQEVARPDGIVVHSGELQSANLPDSHVDVVTAFHTIEHVAEPVTLVAEVCRLLKPGGWVYFQVPNVASWQARLFGSGWGFYSKGHTSYFSPASMIRLLEERGLRIIDLWTFDRGEFLGNLVSVWARRILGMTVLKSLTWRTIQQEGKHVSAIENAEITGNVRRKVRIYHGLERMEHLFNRFMGALGFPVSWVQNKRLAGHELNVVARKPVDPQ